MLDLTIWLSPSLTVLYMGRCHQQSSVFKKFEEQNLFQISCSDIVERFKLVLIISLILLQSNAQDVVYGTVGNRCCFPQATAIANIFSYCVLATDYGHGGRDAD
jgi:hypothetical protein